MASLVWRFILLKSGCEISKWKAFKVHFLSRFGAYVPGKVWFILIRSRLCRTENISQQTVVTSSVLETAMSLTAGSILSLIFMGNIFLNKYYFFFAVIVIIIGSVIVLRPNLFYSLLNFGLKKIGREPIYKETQLNFKNLLVVLFLDLVFLLIWGLSFYLFTSSIVFIPFNKIINVIGIYIISVVIGAWAIFAPYGIGVREGIQAYLLKYIIPFEIGILISLLARIWMTINDVTFNLLIQAINIFHSRLIKKRGLIKKLE